MLKWIQPFIPPILTSFLKKLGYFGIASWEYVPDGFSRHIKNGGWNIEAIAKLQYEKWDAYAFRIKSLGPLGVNHESIDPDKSNDIFFHNLLASFAYVFALSGVNKKTIKFLDWGGGYRSLWVIS